MKEIGAIRNTIEYEFHGVGALGGNACLRWPRLLAANSHAAIESGIAMGVPPSRFFFLPNVVDTDHFFPIPRKEERPLRLLAAGRLVKQKRLDRFLRLLWRLQRQSGARVTGLVVGSGPLEGELRKQAKELELLPDVVEFRAAVSEMKEIYHAADILVVCSDAEGTPNVVLEAMACGLPVVTTRVGGVSEVVRHGETGLLVDPDEEEQLWRSVLLLLEDRQLSRDMGERARESIVGCASLRRLPQILAELYRMVIP